MDFVYFIVLVGVLVFIHELGHFAWAKAFGVRVLRFSVGFGPRVVGIQAGETEYIISALPLGGYVKLLGEGPYDVVKPEERSRAFGFQPLWKRFVIVVAGPVMNLALPVILFFGIHLGDTSLPPAVIGTVFPHRPADGVLQAGDRVLSVDGEPVQTFYEMSRIVADAPGRPLTFEISRSGETLEETITPVLVRTVKELGRVEEAGRIGVRPHHPMAVLGVASPTSPAAVAGLRTFDRVVSVAGRPVERWIDLEEALEAHRGSSIPMTVLRPVRETLGDLGEMALYEPRVATVALERGEGSAAALAGLESAELYVSRVGVGSPEQRMGLLPGDRILSLDGSPVRQWATFIEDLKAGGSRERELTWLRRGVTMNGAFRLERERGVDQHGQRFDRYRIAIGNWMPMRVDPGVDNPVPVSYALSRAFERTAEMIEITVLSVVRILDGTLSTKSIGGIITIFDVAGTAAREGAISYLVLMAFISVNLGMINLLPIPMLDGGHVFFFILEGIARRPVSPRFRQVASLCGLVVLLALMALAIKNDVERQWAGGSETVIQ